MKQILLVEDDQSLSKMYQDQLIGDGFEVFIAHDGKEGLNQAKIKKPSLIILDIAMPKLNGMAMLKELRKDEWGKNVPIIILTIIDPNDKILQQVLELKPVYYLLKANTTPQEISNKIMGILSPAQYIPQS